MNPISTAQCIVLSFGVDYEEDNHVITSCNIYFQREYLFCLGFVTDEATHGDP